MDPDSLLALFKFGKRDHIQQFVSEGVLYMNTLEYFAKLEADSVRRDPNEGVVHVEQPQRVRIGFKENIADDYTSIGSLAAPLRFRDRGSMKTNVFCMYGLRASSTFSLIDRRNFEFGDTFVFLKNGTELLRRAKEAAAAEGYEIRMRGGGVRGRELLQRSDGAIQEILSVLLSE